MKRGLPARRRAVAAPSPPAEPEAASRTAPAPAAKKKAPKVAASAPAAQQKVRRRDQRANARRRLLRRVISQRLGRLGRVLIGTFSFLSSFRSPVIASCPRLKPWNMCSPAMSVDEADASPDGSQRAWSGASRAKGAHTVHDGGVASRDALRVRTRHCICWCPPSACQALVTPTACSLAARRWPLGTPGLVGPAYTRRHELMFGASREKQAPEMSDSVLQKYESISRLLVSRRLYYAYSGGRGALSLRRT